MTVLVRDGRGWVCSRARGRVLEIGVGTGLNLGRYPAGTRVVGIDLSSAMLDIARQRAGRLGRAVDLRPGDAEALEFADESFDSVVITFALSTIPDPRGALAEAKRVLAPGGGLLVLDHGQSRDPFVRAVQRIAGSLTSRLYRDERSRDVKRMVIDHGFIVDEAEAVSGGWVQRLAARKPG